MADGLSVAAANAALDALGSAYPWMQWHTGAPGAAGSANVAGNATRKQVTFAAAASGSKASSADATWSDVEVDTTETYTHASFWSLASGGSFGWSTDDVAGGAVTAGTEVTVQAGDLVASFPTAS